MKKGAILAALLLTSSVWSTRPSQADERPIRTAFVRLGPGVPGVLYEPATPGAKSAIAVFAMHSEVDYLQFSACTELAKRGYRVLCANNSTHKGGIDSDLSIDAILLDAKLAVAWLRHYPGVRKVVLLGHSGGGTLMAAYQSIAENGPRVCQGPEKIIKCSDELAGLPPADGLMLLDSNYGLGAMMLFSLDPAVTGETMDQDQELNPALDSFDPKNGFNPHGSHYSAQFIRRFQVAVGKRNDRLVQNALDRLAKLEKGQGRFSDDEPLVVPGANYLGFNNRLFSQDTRLLAHTHKAWPLLRADGSIVTQIVPSVRVPENMTSNTRSMQKGALRTTVRNFLRTFAVRVGDDFGFDADSIQGVDWSSSYALPAGSVRTVSVPLLTLGMTGHWEYLAAEIIYENARSADKTIAFVEGATHLFTTCTRCEKTPGQYGDTLKTTYDYVDRWLSAPGRF
jgi:pimeloyl-ACP methyl ester carboxylesterase